MGWTVRCRDHLYSPSDFIDSQAQMEKLTFGTKVMVMQVNNDMKRGGRGIDDPAMIRRVRT